MWRFYWKVARRTPRLLLRALRQLDAGIGMLTLAFGAVGVGTWQQLLPWWSPFVAFGVILSYGFLRENYEEYSAVEDERNTLKTAIATADKRRAVKNLLGDAIDQGRYLNEWLHRETDEGKKVTMEDVRDWVHRTRDLIGAIFDKGEARRFLNGDGYK